LSRAPTSSDHNSFPTRRSSDLHLHAKGYTPQSVAVKRSIVMAFARWTERERIGVDDLSEDHLVGFVKRRPPRYTSAVEMSALRQDRKSTRLNSSHEWISYAVFC